RQIRVTNTADMATSYGRDHFRALPRFYGGRPNGERIATDGPQRFPRFRASRIMEIERRATLKGQIGTGDDNSCQLATGHATGFVRQFSSFFRASRGDI